MVEDIDCALFVECLGVIAAINVEYLTETVKVAIAPDVGSATRN